MGWHIKFLAWLEDKRNDLLWAFFDHFFFQDYEWIDLREQYKKYTNLIIEKRRNKIRAEHNEEDIGFVLKDVDLSGHNKIAKQFFVFNLNTNKIVKNCVYANQTRGEYDVFEKNKRTDKFRKRRKKGNIVIVWKGCF